MYPLIYKKGAEMFSVHPKERISVTMEKGFRNNPKLWVNYEKVFGTKDYETNDKKIRT